MAELPADVGTGMVHIALRASIMVAGEQVTIPAVGKVIFTPSADLLRYANDGLLIPLKPVSVYLSNGNADVELIATNDPQLEPLNFTYRVSHDLQDLELAPYDIDVPEGSDRDLSTLVPVASEDGTFFVTGPPGPPGPQGPPGPAGDPTSGGYADLGNVSGAVTLDAAIETHAFTMTADTQVTLSGGANGKTVQIFASGDRILSVQGMAIPTQRALCTLVRGVWTVYTIAGSGDVTTPTAGTLSVVANITDAVLTVSGAADFGSGLHSEPYSFSTNNGSSYSAWQASGTYNAMGLSSGTSYTFRHRTRDAAGNISVGSANTKTTGVAIVWTQRWTDDYTGSNSATLNGRTTTTGSKTHVATGSGAIWGNRACGGPNAGTDMILAPVTQFARGADIQVDYDITEAYSYVTMVVAIGNEFLRYSIGRESGATVTDVRCGASGSTWSYDGPISGDPLTGTMRMICAAPTGGAPTADIYLGGVKKGTLTVGAVVWKTVDFNIGVHTYGHGAGAVGGAYVSYHDNLIVKGGV